MTESQEWFFRRGELAQDGWESVVDAQTPGWSHTALRVAELGAGEQVVVAGTDVEYMIVPLAGGFTVTVVEGDASTELSLAGRSSVFDGPTDVLYVSSASSEIRLSGFGTVAVAGSPTTQRLPTHYLPASGVPVELRGAGTSSRQVHNFGTPGTLDAARLIVCEVITPAGNWSSYPPHKHDEHVAGRESRLEEIYYFAAASTEDGHSDGAFGFFSTSSSPAGDIEIDARVHTGDIALVPFGYHGPAIAAPGYDLYYLNVMAGPDADRAWLITDDPTHAWIRDTWTQQDIDPRLPFGTRREEEQS